MRTYAVAGGGFVKIGRSTRPAGRIVEIQNAVPFVITLIGLVREDIEAEMLGTLRRLGAHARGEWFHDTPAVRRELYLRGMGDGVAEK